MHIGILTSHPIQYQAPWFRALAKQVDLKVFFAHQVSAIEQGEGGFGVAFDWDVDLLSEYSYRFLQNISAKPGVNHFFGCDTPEIITEIAHGNFDAFIVMGWHLKSYWQAVYACRHHSIPVFVRGDSQLHTPRSGLKKLTKAIAYRCLLRWFDGFLFVGIRNREYLSYYGVPKSRMFFSPHFVNNGWFQQCAREVGEQRSQVRSQWGADENTTVCLFVGKFIEKKNPGDLLKALALLKKKSITAIGVFIGAGELESRLRTEAKQLGVVARFLGFKNQTELPLCYVSADVLVLPSESETWGLVVNEAMACGLPAIVSSSVGCGPDLIEPGETGFIFPVGDSAQLAEKIMALGELKRKRYNFTPALNVKLQEYSLERAIHGLLLGVKSLTLKR